MSSAHRAKGFRLTETDLDALRQIKEMNGLESDTEALRVALRFYLRERRPGADPEIRRVLREEVRTAVDRALGKCRRAA